MISPSPSYQRLFDILEHLVDPHVGIIQDVIEVRKEAGAPDLFRFYARACDTSKLGFQKNFWEAGGTSIDRSRAMAKAIGEAIERYCSAIYHVHDFPLHTMNTAPFFCAPPEKFALFSQHQLAQEKFPYYPFTSETKVRWTPATDASSGVVQFVPAAMVYLPYFFGKNEPPIIPIISTGLACHCSEAEAAIAAICEVVERDAFTIIWQARISPPKILIQSLSEQNRALIDQYKKTGASIALFNITLDHGIPTILSIMQHTALDSPAFLLSAASHPNPELAICQTLEELGQCRCLGQILKAQVPPITPTADFENIDSQLSHSRLFCEHTNVHLADFLFSGNRTILFSELPNLTEFGAEEELKSLVEKIMNVGHQVLLADVTTSDIKGLGLSVLRAIIPGFHPLFFGHSFRALGGTRLWEIPQKLGYQGINPVIGDNPIPHPYP